MKKRLVMLVWLALLVMMMPIQQVQTNPTIGQNHTSLNIGAAKPAQSSEYSGVIPMNLSVIVGSSGNELTDAYNYLAAIPFAIRSNSTHTASGLLLPDNCDDYASPLDDWVELLGGAMNELVFLGDVHNPDHLALTSIADTLTTISGSDHVEMAANLAQEFFAGTSSVVLVEAPNANQFSQNVTIADVSATLSAMSNHSQSGSTSSSSHWEYYGTFSPSGGGAIITLTSGDDYIWFDLLSKEGRNYYPMDFPYYDGRTVMFPYEEATTWTLHAIDFYDYSRTVNLHFDIAVPDADFYTFNVAAGEDCRIDFNLSVVGGIPRDIGLNVLDASGNIILNANRFALIQDFDEVSSISVSLSHLQPGQYRAYVYSAENTEVSYNLNIAKRIVSDDRQAAAAGAANGAGLASLLGAPLLYTTGGSLDTPTLQAIQTLAPQTVYFINPTGLVDSDIEDELNSLGLHVNKIENFTEMQSILSALDDRSDSEGSVILYDSIGTTFTAAGLSVAHRKGPAIPFSYYNSNVMTLSQIAEQISWNREYQMPLVATYSLLDIWTSSADFSDMNPPIATMTSIANSFFSWLSMVAGISSVDDVITFAPYYGPGQSLPPSFERAIAGLAEAGRYSSVDTVATLVQVMRSILRIPLTSALSRSHYALGSYLAYSYGDQVMNNNRAYSIIDNSNHFSQAISASGLTPVMQVGPSTVSELNNSPYAWVASVHGGIGQDLYKDDGRIALFSYDTWRAYDSGGSPSSPDADLEESPLNIVNPSEYSLNIYNMSEIVNGSNLRGLFALLDSCQLGSSYGPSIMMEAGADAVVACRTDCFIGPSDLFEHNVISSLIYDHRNLGDALDYAFEINSHRYALSDIGLDTYVSSSDAAIIGASCLQFIVFGDPNITLYDWTATPYPVMDRCARVGPSRAAHAHPGSTYWLPLGMHDPVGNTYAFEGTCSISVFDTDNNLLISGNAICTSQELSVFEIEFSSTAPLGTYDILITDTDLDEMFHSQVILEWPNITIQSIDSSSFTQLGTWNLEILVFNPQDVVAETTVQIRLNNEVLMISDASWLPGLSSNEFEIVVIFGPSGHQILNVILTIGTQDIECCNYNLQVLVSSHWVTPILWIIIPALSVGVVVSGLYSRFRGSKVVSMQQAMQAEVLGDNKAAFDLYCKHNLSKGATRAALKEGFPEEMLSTLFRSFGSAVAGTLNVITNAALIKGDYRLASKINFLLGNSQTGLQYKAFAELEDGAIDDAIMSFHEIASLSASSVAVNVIKQLKTKDELIQSKFVSETKDDILSLATRLQRDMLNQDLVLSLIEGHVEEEDLVRFLVNIGRIEIASERILALKTIPKMVKLTKKLKEDEQNRVALDVIKALTQTENPKKVAKYITSIDIDDRTKMMSITPMIELLLQEPHNEDRISALVSISETSSKGSLPMIEEAIKAVKSLMSAAEKMGVSLEHARSSTLVPVIAGLKGQSMAEKLLSQTEKKVLGGIAPASADITALAEYVHSLRSAVYSVNGVLPLVKSKLMSYEGTLQNRLSTSIQEVSTSCIFILGEDWLEASSNEIANAVASSVPLIDIVSAVKSCFVAVRKLSSHQIIMYLQCSIGFEEQTAMVNELMSNRIERDRLLHRHKRMKMDEQGRMVWVADKDAVFTDAINLVLSKWIPQATSALNLGILKAALKISQIALTANIPQAEVVDISIAFLQGARLSETHIIEYIGSLSKIFKREEVSTILERAGLPSTIIDKVLT
jgi:hypothetical protein